MAFAKQKAHLRARAINTIDALWKAIGDICALLSPAKCMNHSTAVARGTWGTTRVRPQPGMVKTAVANVLSKTPKTVVLHKDHLVVPGKDQVSPFRAAWKISPKGS